ncbi:MAG: hypothetical protein KDK64_05105 [Chlamydiia bacterium]|nr:hypothetical protein [Chlamydiia bacterium]
MMNKANFKKKVYRKLDASPLSETFSFSQPSPSENPKKIIPSMANKGLREKFKKTFLPLLIEIFELRQSIENYKTELQTTQTFGAETPSKSPQEILSRLEQLQRDIEESQRWCDGVILQIAKGIDEAKEALDKKEEGLLKRLLRRITK